MSPRCDKQQLQFHEGWCADVDSRVPPVCSSSFLLFGSGDNLGLPDLAGQQGAALSDGQGSRRRLAVQAEAADHVQQSCAFWLPLLQRKRYLQLKRVHL